MKKLTTKTNFWARLMVGLWTLTPAVEVRILGPEVRERNFL